MTHKGVCIGVGAACGPGQCPVDTSSGRRESLGSNYNSSAGSQNCIGMFAGVSVDSNKRV